MEKKHAKYERLLERCRLLAPALAAVAHPCDEPSLSGAIEAAERGFITPILVGRREKIEAVAKQLGMTSRTTTSSTRPIAMLPPRLRCGWSAKAKLNC
jgi:phosphotransacetylase